MCSTKCLASASSSSGWTGGLDRLMSSGGSTSPLPKNWAQTKLAVARAKYGLSGAVIQSASALRGSSSSATVTGVPSSRRGWAGFLVRRCSTVPVGSILTTTRPIMPPPERSTLAKQAARPK